jgi:hypothetical protein
MLDDGDAQQLMLAVLPFRSIGRMQKNHVIATAAAVTASAKSAVLMRDRSPRVREPGAGLRMAPALIVKRQPQREAGPVPALVGGSPSANDSVRAS